MRGHAKGGFYRVAIGLLPVLIGVVLLSHLPGAAPAFALATRTPSRTATPSPTPAPTPTATPAPSVGFSDSSFQGSFVCRTTALSPLEGGAFGAIDFLQSNGTGNFLSGSKTAGGPSGCTAALVLNEAAYSVHQDGTGSANLDWDASCAPQSFYFQDSSFVEQWLFVLSADQTTLLVSAIDDTDDNQQSLLICNAQLPAVSSASNRQAVAQAIGTKAKGKPTPTRKPTPTPRSSKPTAVPTATAVPSPTPTHAALGFSTASFSGRYICSLNTNKSDFAGSIVLLMADGNGSLVSGTKETEGLGTSSGTTDSSPCTIALAAGSSYTVNSDGTGTATINWGENSCMPGFTEQWFFVLTDNGKTIQISNVDDVSVATETGLGSCSQ